MVFILPIFPFAQIWGVWCILGEGGVKCYPIPMAVTVVVVGALQTTHIFDWLFLDTKKHPGQVYTVQKVHPYTVGLVLRYCHCAVQGGGVGMEFFFCFREIKVWLSLSHGVNCKDSCLRLLQLQTPVGCASHTTIPCHTYIPSVSPGPWHWYAGCGWAIKDGLGQGVDFWKLGCSSRFEPECWVML